MTAPVLADALGPRARRQMRIASVVAAALLVVAGVVVYRRLADNGQLEGDLWAPFTQWAVWRFLLEGLRATLTVAASAMVLAMAIGALAALARLSRTRALRWVALLYVEFFRGLPQLLLIFFAALALPRMGVNLPTFWYLVLGLTAYNSAVLAEIFRAGILSLDRGQSEAALALGMGYWQTMLLVVVPQAVRRMVPVIVSQLVTLLKDTSLGLVIAYEELLRRSQILGEDFRNPLQAVVVASAIYIVVNAALAHLARRLERRQRRRYHAGAIEVAGVDDLTLVAAEGER